MPFCFTTDDSPNPNNYSYKPYANFDLNLIREYLEITMNYLDNPNGIEYTRIEGGLTSIIEVANRLRTNTTIEEKKIKEMV